MSLIYRLPTLADKEILDDYVQEHYDNGETSIHASIKLTSMKFPDWIEYVETMSAIGVPNWGQSDTLMVFDNDRLIGLTSVRYSMDETLRNIYGDIGYGVRPSERRKGYATQILKHGLKRCEKYGMKTVVLGCLEENIASQRTMIRNGGQLVKKHNGYQDGKMNLYYKFTLNQLYR